MLEKWQGMRQGSWGAGEKQAAIDFSYLSEKSPAGFGGCLLAPFPDVSLLVFRLSPVSWSRRSAQERFCSHANASSPFFLCSKLKLEQARQKINREMNGGQRESRKNNPKLTRGPVACPESSDRGTRNSRQGWEAFARTLFSKSCYKTSHLAIRSMRRGRNHL